MDQHKASSPESSGQQVGQSQPQPKKSIVRRIGRGIGWVAGLDVWAKQSRILANRASFPLLREVMKNQARSTRTIIPVQAIRGDLLVSTLRYQSMLVWFLSIILPCALVMFSRGLGMGIRFGDWTNYNLMLGAPLVVIIGLKLLTSLKVCRVVRAELKSRNAGASSNA